MCTYCNSQVQHKNDPAKKSNRNFDAQHPFKYEIQHF